MGVLNLWHVDCHMLNAYKTFLITDRKTNEQTYAIQSLTRYWRHNFNAWQLCIANLIHNLTLLRQRLYEEFPGIITGTTKKSYSILWKASQTNFIFYIYIELWAFLKGTLELRNECCGDSLSFMKFLKYFALKLLRHITLTSSENIFRIIETISRHMMQILMLRISRKSFWICV